MTAKSLMKISFSEIPKGQKKERTTQKDFSRVHIPPLKWGEVEEPAEPLN